MCSHTDAGLTQLKWFFESIISVASDKVLQEKLGISEVTRIIFEGLSVHAAQSLLEISGVPDPTLHLLRLEQMFTLRNKLVSAHLDVFVEEVTSQHLLSVFVVKKVGDQEERSNSEFSGELQVLVVEEDVVVVQEHETGQTEEHHVLLVVRVVNVQVGHVIIPLGIMGIKEHSIKRESWSNSLDNVE
eukprot:CAMPEP_0116878416 /NCGR_PEP_ID=MMETSP0463-20121206/10180_1 /TAXON_ID=181622 /ORGANISM="Strombidinopsis sp, Strain SopsisLIS2011" /LENGTH=186 /DNA_ID=CAMNT_0004526643 /DNA_START=86 /DNA_END=646 /DNA_ORIENTATION=-